MTVHPKEINVGDILYECDHGRNFQHEVLTKPVSKHYDDDDENRFVWTWKAKHVQTDRELDYLYTDGFGHYGPKLYRDPVYMTQDKNGDTKYPLVGE